LYCFLFFFFNDTATTEIYTLSLHDALPISSSPSPIARPPCCLGSRPDASRRSEEHTSELQSHLNRVCRLLLEKKKQNVLYVLRAQLHSPAGRLRAPRVGE